MTASGEKRATMVAALILTIVPGIVLAGKKDEAAPWPEITDAERALTSLPQDPEADAVVLRNDRRGTLRPVGRYLYNILEYHWRLKILTDRGRRYGEISIPAAGKLSRVRDLEARTIKPDGTVIAVAADQIFQKTVRETAGFKETASVFKFPAAEPGAILEYRYIREDSSVLFIDPWIFAGPEFTLASVMSQVIPEDMHYTMLCDKCPSPEPVRTEWREGKSKGRRYTLEERDLPGYREEFLMPPERDVTARAEMSLKGWQYTTWEELKRDDALFTDWHAVAQFAGYRYSKVYLTDEVAIRDVVAGWLQGIDDPEARVRTIFSHVQKDFRYLAYDDVFGSSRSITTLLKDRTADNEEKAVLLVAALRSIGLDPRIALVAGRHKGMLYSNFHTLSFFSHAIVGLPLADGSMQWLDPTATYTRFGRLPWKDAGAAGLVLNGTSGQLITLPDEVDAGTARHQVVIRPRPDGKADLEVESEFTGEAAVHLREALVPAAETARLSYLQAWVGRRREGSALRAHTLHDLEDFEKALRMTLRIEAPGLVTGADELLLVRGCALTCQEGNPVEPRPRLYPFYVDPGWSHEEAVAIVVADGLQVGALPAPSVVRSPFGTVNFGCKSETVRAVCTRKISVPKNRLSPEAQKEVRTFYDRVIEIDRRTITLQPAVAHTGGRPLP